MSITEFEPQNPNLTARSMAGVRWLTLSLVVTSILQMVSVAVTSRFLSPEDVGLLAAVSILMRLLLFFSGLGVSNAIVQFPSIDRDFLRTALSCSLVAGAAGALLCAPLAPLAEVISGDPRAKALALVMAGSLLLQGPGQVGGGLLRRQMRFRELAIVDVAAYTTGYIFIGIPLAVVGAGPWALASAAIVQGLASGCGTFFLSRAPWRPAFNGDTARRIVAFGAKATTASFIEGWGSNIDNLGVGLSRSASDLGLYFRGATLVTMPLVQVSIMIVRVFGAALSRVSPARFSSALQDLLVMVALAVFPLAGILAAAAPALVSVLLGSQWSDAAYFLPISLAAVSVECINSVLGSATESRGIMTERIWVQLISAATFAVVVTIACVTGAGLWAFAGAWLVAGCVRLACFLLLLSSRTGFRAKYALSCLAKIALMTAPAAAVAFAFVRLDAYPIVQLLVSSLAGGVTFLATWALLAPMSLRMSVLERVRSCRIQQLPRFVEAGIGGRRYRSCISALAANDEEHVHV